MLLLTHRSQQVETMYVPTGGKMISGGLKGLETHEDIEHKSMKQYWKKETNFCLKR